MIFDARRWHSTQSASYLQGMIACTPPPPPLASVVRQATAVVNERIAPLDAPAVCLAGDVPRGSGMATPGTVWFSSADAATFARPARTWPADRPMVVLHEVLHQVAMRQGLEDGPDMATEEGVVEAVTHDLRPVWLKRVRGQAVPVPVAYPQWVATVRRASARATSAPWTSPAARAWRARVLATPPAQRVLP